MTPDSPAPTGPTCPASGSLRSAIGAALFLILVGGLVAVACRRTAGPSTSLAPVATGAVPAAIVTTLATPPSGVADPDDQPGPTGPSGGLVEAIPPGAAPSSASGAPYPLTAPGCCARPFWRADGAALWFIDRPPGGPTGVYEAALDSPLAQPRLITGTIGALSPDQRYRVDQEAGRTTLLRLADGRRFEVAAAGRALSFSPGGGQVAWQAGGGPENAGGGQPQNPANRVFVSAVEGGEAREVVSLANGSLLGWLSEGELLLRVREGRDSVIDELRAQGLDGGPPRSLLRAERLRGLTLSSDRSWLAQTPGANGLWVAGTRPGSAPPRRIDGLFGAFKWRDARRLLVVPLEMGAPAHRLLELDMSDGKQRTLSDPAAPFRIADGDWSVSPDGRHLAFANAADDAIWVLPLGD